MNAGILYYTCNTHDARIEAACRAQLLAAAGGLPIWCVSRMPTEFGNWNIVLEGRRSPEMMHRQILTGLERMEIDAVFLAESDVLYHAAHFEFLPPSDSSYFYNVNVWRIRFGDGHAVRTADCRQVSGCCANRLLLLEHYRKRCARIEAEGKFDRRIGYEPGAHRPPRGIDDYPSVPWGASCPNVDIRHDKNLTLSKWSPADFRNPRYAAGWQETDEQIPCWGRGADMIARIRECYEHTA